MLGTPNGGSFAPIQVLSGDDSFGNLFTTWGGLFDGSGPGHYREHAAQIRQWRQAAA